MTMDKLLNQRKPTETKPPQQLTDLDYLQQIAGHLKSIRSMLTFFTVLAVLAMIIQFFSFLM